MEFKLNLITPSLYSESGPNNCVDLLSEEFADYVKHRANNEFNTPCKYSNVPGLAYIHQFEEFEERFLIHSEYAVIIASQHSQKAIKRFLPRLLVFLTSRSIWQNRFLFVLLGDVEVTDSLVIHPPIRFSLTEWRTQDQGSWTKLFELIKVKWTPYVEDDIESEQVSKVFSGVSSDTTVKKLVNVGTQGSTVVKDSFYYIGTGIQELNLHQLSIDGSSNTEGGMWDDLEKDVEKLVTSIKMGNENVMMNIEEFDKNNEISTSLGTETKSAIDNSKTKNIEVDYGSVGSSNVTIQENLPQNEEIKSSIDFDVEKNEKETIKYCEQEDVLPILNVNKKCFIDIEVIEDYKKIKEDEEYNTILMTGKTPFHINLEEKNQKNYDYNLEENRKNSTNLLQLNQQAYSNVEEKEVIKDDVKLVKEGITKEFNNNSLIEKRNYQNSDSKSKHIDDNTLNYKETSEHSHDYKAVLSSEQDGIESMPLVKENESNLFKSYEYNSPLKEGIEKVNVDIDIKRNEDDIGILKSNDKCHKQTLFKDIDKLDKNKLEYENEEKQFLVKDQSNKNLIKVENRDKLIEKTMDIKVESSHSDIILHTNKDTEKKYDNLVKYTEDHLEKSLNPEDNKVIKQNISLSNEEKKNFGEIKKESNITIQEKNVRYGEDKNLVNIEMAENSQKNPELINKKELEVKTDFNKRIFYIGRDSQEVCDDKVSEKKKENEKGIIIVDEDISSQNSKKDKDFGDRDLIEKNINDTVKGKQEEITSKSSIIHPDIFNKEVSKESEIKDLGTQQSAVDQLRSVKNKFKVNTRSSQRSSLTSPTGLVQIAHDSRIFSSESEGSSMEHTTVKSSPKMTILYRGNENFNPDATDDETEDNRFYLFLISQINVVRSRVIPMIQSSFSSFLRYINNENITEIRDNESIPISIRHYLTKWTRHPVGVIGIFLAATILSPYASRILRQIVIYPWIVLDFINTLFLNIVHHQQVVTPYSMPIVTIKEEAPVVFQTDYFAKPRNSFFNSISN